MKTEPSYDHPQGFDWLRKSDKQLYVHLKRFVRLAFDKIDTGWKYFDRKTDEDQIARNSLEKLNYWNDSSFSRKRNENRLNKKPHPFHHVKELSLKKIERHFKHEETLYYTSASDAESPDGRRMALFMLDIDNHKGCEYSEPEDVAKLWAECHSIFPGIFNQQSTHGKGWHGFLLIEYREPVTKCREVFSLLSNALQSHFKTHKAIIELKGKPGIRKATGGFEICGLLAKIPRLPHGDASAIRDFLNQQKWTLSELEDIAKKLNPEAQATAVPGGVPPRAEEERHSNGNPSSGSSEDAHTTAPLEPYHTKNYLSATSTTVRWDTNAECGKTRRAACASYCMIHGITDVNEVLNQYHRHYHHTGMEEKDIRKRVRDFHRLFKKFQPTFKPPKQSRYPHAFKRHEFLELIQRTVPQSAYSNSDSHHRFSVDAEKLSDFLSIKIQDAFFSKENRWFGRTSRDATIQNMRAMREKGMVGWVANNHTYKHLLDICVQYDLLRIEEKHTPPSSGADCWMVVPNKWKGKARLIAPGPALSELREEWLKLYQSKSDLLRVA